MKKCSNCGTHIKNDDMYCYNCGKRVTGDSGIEIDTTPKYDKKIDKTEDDAALILGILSIVLGFSIPFIGLVLGIIGVNRNCSEHNKKLNRWGIWISAIIIIAYIIIVIVWFSIMIRLTPEPSTPNTYEIMFSLLK